MLDEVLRAPGARVIASTTPLTREEDVRAHRPQRRLGARDAPVRRPTWSRQGRLARDRVPGRGAGIDLDLLVSRVVTLNRAVDHGGLPVRDRRACPSG